MWILKSYQNSLPGNYSYAQTEGAPHNFKSNPVMEELVKQVSAFRIANKLSRASLAESLEDIDVYNCRIRNNDPRFCWNCPRPFGNARHNHPFFRKSCDGCGKPANP